METFSIFASLVGLGGLGVLSFEFSHLEERGVVYFFNCPLFPFDNYFYRMLFLRVFLMLSQEVGGGVSFLLGAVREYCPVS